MLFPFELWSQTAQNSFLLEWLLVTPIIGTLPSYCGYEDKLIPMVPGTRLLLRSIRDDA